jgi:hypothetical protein
MNKSNIKIIQILTNPDSIREQKSIESLSKLDYRYIKIINKRYNKIAPLYNIFDNNKN